ncbi:MAG: glycosyltransferase family 2 protein, partial [Chloroflexi bacterium]|nr:glycosyltransferase family 2 protein [Chloroflexota bacterium]
MSEAYSPLISLAMPVYNAAPYLGQAIESILSQTYENIEVVICDNCSTDTSPAIAREFQAKDKRVRFYPNNWNIGFSGNLQKSTSLAKGDFILVHAADDFLLPNAIERFVQIVRENATAAENAVVTSDFLVVDQQGKSLSRQTLDDTRIEHLHVEPHGDGKQRPLVQHYRGKEVLIDRFPILATIGWIGSTMFSKQLYDRVEGYFSNHW